ncbi:polyprotein [Morchella importuna endornavirus 1]|nr:polyprotein [Morchella importuna endornavirus 1]
MPSRANNTTYRMFIKHTKFYKNKPFCGFKNTADKQLSKTILRQQRRSILLKRTSWRPKAVRRMEKNLKIQAEKEKAEKLRQELLKIAHEEKLKIAEMKQAIERVILEEQNQEKRNSLNTHLQNKQNTINYAHTPVSSIDGKLTGTCNDGKTCIIDNNEEHKVCLVCKKLLVVGSKPEPVVEEIKPAAEPKIGGKADCWSHLPIDIHKRGWAIASGAPFKFNVGSKKHQHSMMAKYPDDPMPISEIVNDLSYMLKNSMAKRKYLNTKYLDLILLDNGDYHLEEGDTYHAGDVYEILKAKWDSVKDNVKPIQPTQLLGGEENCYLALPISPRSMRIKHTKRIMKISKMVDPKPVEEIEEKMRLFMNRPENAKFMNLMWKIPRYVLEELAPGKWHVRFGEDNEQCVSACRVLERLGEMVQINKDNIKAQEAATKTVEPEEWKTVLGKPGLYRHDSGYESTENIDIVYCQLGKTAVGKLPSMPKPKVITMGYNALEEIARHTGMHKSDVVDLTAVANANRDYTATIVKAVYGGLKNKLHHAGPVDDKTLRALTDAFPEYDIIRTPGSAHPHPFNATARSLVTSILYERLGYRQTIIDIGGNAYTHSVRDRHNVHCCYRNETMEEKDKTVDIVSAMMEQAGKSYERLLAGSDKANDAAIMANLMNKIENKMCLNRCEDCDFIGDKKFTYCMSVDTLYHMTTEQLALSFAKHNIVHGLHAIFFPIDALVVNKGNLPMNEGTWEVVDGEFRMRTHGDSKVYAHPMDKIIQWLTTPIIVCHDFSIVVRIEGFRGGHIIISTNRIDNKFTVEELYLRNVWMTDTPDEQIYQIPIIDVYEPKGLLDNRSIKVKTVKINSRLLDLLCKRIADGPETPQELLTYAKGLTYTIHTTTINIFRPFDVSDESLQDHCCIAMERTTRLLANMKPLFDHATSAVEEKAWHWTALDALINFGKKFALHIDPTQVDVIKEFIRDNRTDNIYSFKKLSADAVKGWQAFENGYLSGANVVTYKSGAVYHSNITSPSVYLNNFEMNLAVENMPPSHTSKGRFGNNKVKAAKCEPLPSCPHNHDHVFEHIATGFKCVCCGVDDILHNMLCSICNQDTKCKPTAACDHEHKNIKEHCCGQFKCSCVLNIRCECCRIFSAKTPCNACCKPTRTRAKWVGSVSEWYAKVRGWNTNDQGRLVTPSISECIPVVDDQHGHECPMCKNWYTHSHKYEGNLRHDIFRGDCPFCEDSKNLKVGEKWENADDEENQQDGWFSSGNLKSGKPGKKEEQPGSEGKTDGKKSTQPNPPKDKNGKGTKEGKVENKSETKDTGKRGTAYTKEREKTKLEAVEGYTPGVKVWNHKPTDTVAVNDDFTHNHRCVKCGGLYQHTHRYSYLNHAQHVDECPHCNDDPKPGKRSRVRPISSMSEGATVKVGPKPISTPCFNANSVSTEYKPNKIILALVSKYITQRDMRAKPEDKVEYKNHKNEIIGTYAVGGAKKTYTYRLAGADKPLRTKLPWSLKDVFVFNRSFQDTYSLIDSNIMTNTAQEPWNDILEKIHNKGRTNKMIVNHPDVNVMFRSKGKIIYDLVDRFRVVTDQFEPINSNNLTSTILRLISYYRKQALANEIISDDRTTVSYPNQHRMHVLDTRDYDEDESVETGTDDESASGSDDSSDLDLDENIQFVHSLNNGEHKVKIDNRVTYDWKITKDVGTPGSHWIKPTNDENNYRLVGTTHDQMDTMKVEKIEKLPGFSLITSSKGIQWLAKTPSYEIDDDVINWCKENKYVSLGPDEEGCREIDTHKQPDWIQKNVVANMSDIMLVETSLDVSQCNLNDIVSVNDVKWLQNEGTGDCGYRALRHFMALDLNTVETLTGTTMWHSSDELGMLANHKGRNLITYKNGEFKVYRANHNPECIFIMDATAQGFKNHWVAAQFGKCYGNIGQVHETNYFFRKREWINQNSMEPDISYLEALSYVMSPEDKATFHATLKHSGALVPQVLKMLVPFGLKNTGNFHEYTTKVFDRSEFDKFVVREVIGGRQISRWNHPTSFGKTTQAPKRLLTHYKGPFDQMVLVVPYVAIARGTWEDYSKDYKHLSIYYRAGEIDQFNLCNASNKNDAVIKIFTRATFANQLASSPLKEKTIVCFDEVHAMDGYLYNALSCMKVNRNPIILMSATQGDLSAYKPESKIPINVKFGNVEPSMVMKYIEDPENANKRIAIICPTVTYGREKFRFNQKLRKQVEEINRNSLSKTKFANRIFMCTSIMAVGVNIPKLDVIFEMGERIEVLPQPFSNVITPENVSNATMVSYGGVTMAAALQTLGRVGRGSSPTAEAFIAIPTASDELPFSFYMEAGIDVPVAFEDMLNVLKTYRFSRAHNPRNVSSDDLERYQTLQTLAIAAKKLNVNYNILRPQTADEIIRSVLTSPTIKKLSSMNAVLTLGANPVGNKSRAGKPNADSWNATCYDCGETFMSLYDLEGSCCHSNLASVNKENLETVWKVSERFNWSHKFNESMVPTLNLEDLSKNGRMTVKDLRTILTTVHVIKLGDDLMTAFNEVATTQPYQRTKKCNIFKVNVKPTEEGLKFVANYDLYDIQTSRGVGLLVGEKIVTPCTFSEGRINPRTRVEGICFLIVSRMKTGHILHEMSACTSPTNTSLKEINKRIDEADVKSGVASSGKTHYFLSSGYTIVTKQVDMVRKDQTGQFVSAGMAMHKPLPNKVCFDEATMWHRAEMIFYNWDKVNKVAFIGDNDQIATQNNVNEFLVLPTQNLGGLLAKDENPLRRARTVGPQFGRAIIQFMNFEYNPDYPTNVKVLPINSPTGKKVMQKLHGQPISQIVTVGNKLRDEIMLELSRSTDVKVKAIPVTTITRYQGGRCEHLVCIFENVAEMSSRTEVAYTMLTRFMKNGTLLVEPEAARHNLIMNEVAEKARTSVDSDNIRSGNLNFNITWTALLKEVNFFRKLQEQYTMMGENRAFGSVVYLLCKLFRVDMLPRFVGKLITEGIITEHKIVNNNLKCATRSVINSSMQSDPDVSQMEEAMEDHDEEKGVLWQTKWNKDITDCLAEHKFPMPKKTCMTTLRYYNEAEIRFMTNIAGNVNSDCPPPSAYYHVEGTGWSPAHQAYISVDLSDDYVSTNGIIYKNIPDWLTETADEVGPPVFDTERIDNIVVMPTMEECCCHDNGTKCLYCVNVDNEHKNAMMIDCFNRRVVLETSGEGLMCGLNAISMQVDIDEDVLKKAILSSKNEETGENNFEIADLLTGCDQIGLGLVVKTRENYYFANDHFTGSDNDAYVYYSGAHYSATMLSSERGGFLYSDSQTPKKFDRKARLKKILKDAWHQHDYFVNVYYYNHVSRRLMRWLKTLWASFKHNVSAVIEIIVDYLRRAYLNVKTAIVGGTPLRLQDVATAQHMDVLMKLNERKNPTITIVSDDVKILEPIAPEHWMRKDLWDWPRNPNDDEMLQYAEYLETFDSNLNLPDWFFVDEIILTMDSTGERFKNISVRSAFFPKITDANTKEMELHMTTIRGLSSPEWIADANVEANMKIISSHRTGLYNLWTEWKTTNERLSKMKKTVFFDSNDNVYKRIQMGLSPFVSAFRSSDKIVLRLVKDLTVSDDVMAFLNENGVFFEGRDLLTISLQPENLGWETYDRFRVLMQTQDIFGEAPFPERENLILYGTTGYEITGDSRDDATWSCGGMIASLKSNILILRGYNGNMENMINTSCSYLITLLESSTSDAKAMIKGAMVHHSTDGYVTQTVGQDQTKPVGPGNQIEEITRKLSLRLQVTNEVKVDSNSIMSYLKSSLIGNYRVITGQGLKTATELNQSGFLNRECGDCGKVRGTYQKTAKFTCSICLGFDAVKEQPGRVNTRIKAADGLPAFYTLGEYVNTGLMLDILWSKKNNYEKPTEVKGYRGSAGTGKTYKLERDHDMVFKAGDFNWQTWIMSLARSETATVVIDELSLVPADFIAWLTHQTTVFGTLDPNQSEAPCLLIDHTKIEVITNKLELLTVCHRFGPLGCKLTSILSSYEVSAFDGNRVDRIVRFNGNLNTYHAIVDADITIILDHETEGGEKIFQGNEARVVSVVVMPSFSWNPEWQKILYTAMTRYKTSLFIWYKTGKGPIMSFMDMIAPVDIGALVTARGHHDVELLNVTLKLKNVSDEDRSLAIISVGQEYIQAPIKEPKEFNREEWNYNFANRRTRESIYENMGFSQTWIAKASGSNIYAQRTSTAGVTFLTWGEEGQPDTITAMLEENLQSNGDIIVELYMNKKPTMLQKMAVKAALSMWPGGSTPEETVSNFRKMIKPLPGKLNAMIESSSDVFSKIAGNIINWFHDMFMYILSSINHGAAKLVFNSEQKYYVEEMDIGHYLDYLTQDSIKTVDGPISTIKTMFGYVINYNNLKTYVSVRGQGKTQIVNVSVDDKADGLKGILLLDDIIRILSTNPQLYQGSYEEYTMKDSVIVDVRMKDIVRYSLVGNTMLKHESDKSVMSVRNEMGQSIEIATIMKMGENRVLIKPNLTNAVSLDSIIANLEHFCDDNKRGGNVGAWKAFKLILNTVWLKIKTWYHKCRVYLTSKPIKQQPEPITCSQGWYNDFVYDSSCSEEGTRFFREFGKSSTTTILSDCAIVETTNSFIVIEYKRGAMHLRFSRKMREFKPFVARPWGAVSGFLSDYLHLAKVLMRNEKAMDHEQWIAAWSAREKDRVMQMIDSYRKYKTEKKRQIFGDQYDEQGFFIGRKVTDSPVDKYDTFPETGRTPSKFVVPEFVLDDDRTQSQRGAGMDMERLIASWLGKPVEEQSLPETWKKVQDQMTSRWNQYVNINDDPGIELEPSQQLYDNFEEDDRNAPWAFKTIFVCIPPGGGKTTLKNMDPENFIDVDDIREHKDWTTVPSANLSHMLAVDASKTKDSLEKMCRGKSDYGKIILCHHPSQVPNNKSADVVISVHTWTTGKMHEEMGKNDLVNLGKKYSMYKHSSIEDLRQMLKDFKVSQLMAEINEGDIHANPEQPMFPSAVAYYESMSYSDIYEIPHPTEGTIKIKMPQYKKKETSRVVMGKWPAEYNRPVFHDKADAIYCATSKRLWGVQKLRKVKQNKHEVFERFKKAYFVGDQERMLKEFETNKVAISDKGTGEWIRTHKKMEQVIAELYKMFKESGTNNLLNMFNNHVKAESLYKEDVINHYSEIVPRLIVWHPKIFASLFCPVMNELKRRLKMLFKTNVVYTDGLTHQGIEEKLARFSPDWKQWEMDFSKQDRQTDQNAMEFEFHLYEKLGMDQETLELWKSCHATWISRSSHTKGKREWMRKTGDASTALGNAINNFRAILRLAEDPRFRGALILGDDSHVFYEGEDFDLKWIQRSIERESNMKATKESNLLGSFCQLIVSYIPNKGWSVCPDLKRLYERFTNTNKAMCFDEEEHRVRAASYVYMIGNNEMTRKICRTLKLATPPNRRHSLEDLIAKTCLKRGLTYGSVSEMTRYLFQELENNMTTAYKATFFVHSR